MNSRHPLRRIARFASNARPLAQPVWPFAIALVALTWIAVARIVVGELASLEADDRREAENITINVEQNVIRMAENMDRILKSLRRVHAEAEGRADWPRIVRQDHLFNDATVQIAVIDADGMMITSSAMPYPDKKVDLSDREHFQVHRNSKTDALFVSKPVLGRASGKWTIQFTRGFNSADGSFAGVLVVSLDTDYIARAYADMKMRDGTGLALVGDDGVVRGGTGAFMDLMGGVFGQAGGGGSNGIEARLDDPALVARPVAGYPLKVVASLRRIEDDEAWTHRKSGYFAGALGFSMLVLIAAAGSAMRGYRHEARILHLARHDTLTSLANRSLFQEKLDDVFSGRAGDLNFALHIVDLDGFKLVNDTHGHWVGDLLLDAVARRIRNALREDEVLARLGGDEFGILQKVIDFRLEAGALASRLCAAISEPFDISGYRVVIGASIGVASAATDANGSVDLVKAADLALYAAKACGRGIHRFFEEHMTASVRRRVEVESGLRAAVAMSDFEIHYQPIVCMETSAVLAHEALLRWREPERGLISPMEFIAIAEETNLILPMGEWVLHQACRDIARLGGNIGVAVNCSAAQFKRSNFVATVRSALEQSGLEANCLEIEITESMLIKDDAHVNQQLHELRALGVRISMDDFGTGFSCLSYLEQYPIDTIKIDQSFTRKLTRSESSQMVVRAIVELARGLGMKTIAEGVETVEQLRILKSLGCSEAQGYLFGKPAPGVDALSARDKSSPPLVAAA